MARTDALANEGFDRRARTRCRRTSKPERDMVFPEAITDWTCTDEVRRRGEGAGAAPTSPNSARRRCSPSDELRSAGVAHRRSTRSPAFRAMNQAALQRLRDRAQATARRKTSSTRMQTREELYDYLNYHAYEQKLDELFSDAPKPKKSVALSGRPGRQHRAVHRRTHRQRPALPRLRHPRLRRPGGVRGSGVPAGAREAADTARNWMLTRRNSGLCGHFASD